MTVKILGTIVSPDYDDEFFASWIDKGVITPSSRIVAALESATEPVDVYINSYGGDVFAGGEMLIALSKCKTRKCLGTVEVGSVAASMAANIVASLKAQGAKVVGHSNSELMFHGCYTSTEGGAQLHEDIAESLRNINEAVIANLNRIGIENCRAWFAEGRQKWLSADDCRELGIFDEIAESASVDSLVEPKQTASRLAAFAASLTTRKDYSIMMDKVISEAEKPVETPAETTVAENPAEPAAPAETPAEPAEESPATAETPAETPAEQPAPEADIEARVAELANKRFAGLQAKHDKMISDLTAERDAALKDLSTANTMVTSLQADVEKLEKDLAAVRDQLSAEQKAHESVVAGALKPENTKAYASVRDQIASGMRLAK